MGLSAGGAKEAVKIDLSGTQLICEVPKRSLGNSEFFQGRPKDLRPFVNTIARTEYRNNPYTRRGSCEFYESGWWLYSKRRWKKQKRGIVKLQVSLETPARNEYESYPNLFSERYLRDWLLLYYRDRQSIFDQTSLTTHADGMLEIEFTDKHETSQLSLDQELLHKLPRQVSGLPCYFIYLNPGIIEFNLPIARHDVLQIRFQIRYLTKDIAIKEQLNSETLKLAHEVVSTVQIILSEREIKNRDMFMAITDGN